MAAQNLEEDDQGCYPELPKQMRLRSRLHDIMASAIAALSRASEQKGSNQDNATTSIIDVYDTQLVDISHQAFTRLGKFTLRRTFNTE